MVKILLILLFPFGLFCSINLYGQADPFAELQHAALGAHQWFTKHSAALQQLERKQQDPNFAKAIVYPELLRYAKLRDQLETIALQVLYIQLGTDYADFSIGPFQMKPSFAAGLDQWKDTEEHRKKRIELLSSVNGQIHYLGQFLTYMDNRFKNRQWTSVEEKLRLYATAYNAGYRCAETVLLKLASLQQFKLAEWDGSSYSYAALSQSYYRQLLASN